MEDEKKCRVGGMYEAIYLRGKALDYCQATCPNPVWAGCLCTVTNQLGDARMCGWAAVTALGSESGSQLGH